MGASSRAGLGARDGEKIPAARVLERDLWSNLGDKISGGGQTGSIVEIARVNKNTLKVLSTLKTTDSESEKLKLEQNDESQIRMLPLPYAIT